MDYYVSFNSTVIINMLGIAVQQSCVLVAEIHVYSLWSAVSEREGDDSS